MVYGWMDKVGIGEGWGGVWCGGDWEGWVGDDEGWWRRWGR